MYSSGFSSSADRFTFFENPRESGLPRSEFFNALNFFNGALNASMLRFTNHTCWRGSALSLIVRRTTRQRLVPFPRLSTNPVFVNPVFVSGPPAWTCLMMNMRYSPSISALLGLLLLNGCSSDGPASTQCALDDTNCDGVPDHLGTAVLDENGNWRWIDFDNDGVADQPAVDVDGDGTADAGLLDTDGDGLGDALDFDGDGVADGGPGGTGGTGSDVGGTGGGTSTGGTDGEASFGPGCLAGTIDQSPTGYTTEQYFQTDVTRNGVNFRFIANGWGDNFGSHEISYDGTSFVVDNMTGSEGANWSPASYPTVYCGDYSNTGPSGACGLPAPVSSITSMETGLRWSKSNDDGEYNVAYDVWLGNGGSHSGYFMVWYRRPGGQQPAGSVQEQGVTVPNVPGKWNIWTGSVNGKPIISYIRDVNDDVVEMAFDMMDFFDDATSRDYSLPGTEVRGVAIGIGIWNGPVSGLAVEDFCLEVN